MLSDPSFKGGGTAITVKCKFVWTMMICQPDFVTAEIFEAAKAVLAKKKPAIDTTKASCEKMIEGLCVQVMHIDPYDDEPATVTAMDKYAIENSYEIDMDGNRRHHEIYISDPRNTAPEKLKIIISHPIRRSR